VAGGMRAMASKAKDEVFASTENPLSDFAFNAETASVFEDMLERSVPFYLEIQRLLAELAADFAEDGTAVYDVGCSTGTTLLALDALPQDVMLIGLDNSPAMLERAAATLNGQLRHRFALRAADLNAGLAIENASVVVMSLTLQFVRPIHRELLLRQICEGINRDGCLLLVEKVVTQESLLNRLYIQHYHEFKQRNGYSAMEISRKREALENILVPYRLEENHEMLQRAGFRAVDAFFKWYNFCGLVAVR
jgi:tRNA (cmo5U34)-methyltransferase